MRARSWRRTPGRRAALVALPRVGGARRPRKCGSGDLDVEALRSYTEVLGFRLRDAMSMPGEFIGKEPGSKVWLRFLGVNRRHHSLAFLPFPNDSKCVHVMFEVDELDHVGSLERVKKHGAHLSATWAGT